MDRRSLFRLLPMSVLAVPSMAKAAMEPPKAAAEPSPWVEMVCQRERYDWPSNGLLWRCGTRFKFIRGAHPFCPKCGALQSITRDNGGQSLMDGIEVKD
jgi:hypothetical protein